MTTKEKVLNELSHSTGRAVSGQHIADLCGVSRAAVWKAINSLRNDGWEIDASTNGGYVLSDDSDIFSQAVFEETFYKSFPLFKTEKSKIHIECKKEIDSTNTYAKRLLTDNSSIKTGIIVAEKQTAGRGRLGRTFCSPSNTGIYLSVIYSPSEGIRQPARLTAFAAVAVCRAIKKLYGADLSIKWVNDVFLNGKKICGILTEGFTNFESGRIDSAIIGIGVNIKQNDAEFSEDAKKIAGALESVSLSKKVKRCELSAEIAGQVLTILEATSSGDVADENTRKVIDEYKKASFILGSEIKVYPIAGKEADSYKAVAVDIDENAGLIVEMPDGVRKKLTSGEVTLKSSNF